MQNSELFKLNFLLLFLMFMTGCTSQSCPAGHVLNEQSVCIPQGILSTDLSFSSTSHKQPSESPSPKPDPPKSTPSSKFLIINPPLATVAEVPQVPDMDVRYGGSTTMAPIRPRKEWYADRSLHPQRPDELIMQVHSNFKLTYIPPISGEAGSNEGITRLLTGQLSVAQSSRPLEPEEQKKDLQAIPVATDGIILYINRDLKVPGLTVSQVKDIYIGKITNWNQVGGPDLKITPFSRSPDAGGTPEFFRKEVLQKEKFALSVEIITTTTATIQRIQSTPSGIGYATASEVCNQNVQSLPLARNGEDFISPCNGQQVNRPAFANGSYPITRRLFVIVKRDGTLDEQAGVAYANMLLTDEAQQLIEQVGFVKLH